MRSLMLLLILLGTGLSVTAQGGGLLLYEVGTSAIGNAYAGQSALTEDASSAYLNPAAMGQVEGESFLIGAQGIFTTIDYLGDNGNTAEGGGLTPTVGFYWVKKLSEKVSFGATINIPLGSGFNYGKDWDGRYYAESALLAVTNIAPSFSYNVSESFSVGATMNMYLGLLEEELALKPLNPFNGTDGQATLSGMNFNMGFQLGLHYHPNENTALGLMYRYKSAINLDGDADIEGYVGQDEGEITTLPFSTEMLIPHGLNLGWTQRFNNTQFLMDLGYTNWAAFEGQPIVLNESFEGDLHRNWQNTYRIGLGINQNIKTDLIGRVGFSYDSDPIRPDEMSPDMPVGEAYRVALGITKKTKKDNSISLSWCMVISEGQNIDLSNSAQGDLKGSYSKLGLNTIGLSYGF